MTERMTAAEFAARRQLIGLSGAELAAAWGVNPRTVRAWELGRDLIPLGAASQMEALIAEHTALAHEMVDSDVVVYLPRGGSGLRPRSWYVAAAARAVAIEPDMMLEWRD